jgi:hypothetical protein
MEKLLVIAKGHSPREFVGVFSLVELLFDRLAEGKIIQVPQDEIRFENLAKLFEHPIQGMLFGIRVEALEQLRGRGLLKFNRGHKAQDVVPLLDDRRRLNIGLGENAVAVLFIRFTPLKGIQPLPAHILGLFA